MRTADLGAHKDFLCTSKHSDIGVKNKADLRAWEKKLQQKTSEKSAEKLVLMATEQVKQCFMVLPQHGRYTLFSVYVLVLVCIIYAAFI